MIITTTNTRLEAAVKPFDHCRCLGRSKNKTGKLKQKLKPIKILDGLNFEKNHNKKKKKSKKERVET